MPMQEANRRQHIIKNLLSQILNKIPTKQQLAFKTFLNLFFSMDTTVDLYDGHLHTLEKVALSFWDFMEDNSIESPIIDIFTTSLPINHTTSNQVRTVIRILYKEMPFLVDSIRIKLNEMNIPIHLIRNGVLTVNRDHENKRLFHEPYLNKTQEEFIYLEIDYPEDGNNLEALKANIIWVLMDVTNIVNDFEYMKKAIMTISHSLSFTQTETANTTQSFLNWLIDNNFVFLGFEKIKFSPALAAKEPLPKVIETTTSLGMLRPLQKKDPINRLYITLPLYTENHNEQLLFIRAPVRSTVHRSAYPDVVIIREINAQGHIIAQNHIMGLFTSLVYRQSVKTIPFLDKKVAQIIQKANLVKNSHYYKDMEQILEVYPRDELFHTPNEILFKTLMAILRLQERKQLRIFIKKEQTGHFCSVLLYAPKDIYSTQLRTKIQTILAKAFNATDIERSTYFSESVLARVHFIFKINTKLTYNLAAIQKKILQATITWEASLTEALTQIYGRKTTNFLMKKYGNGFSEAYKESFNNHLTIKDIEQFENLSTNQIAVYFYRDPQNDAHDTKFKLIYPGQQKLSLSERISILENLGLTVQEEYTYSLKMNNQMIIIHDYLLNWSDEHHHNIWLTSNAFNQAFKKIWFGAMANDSLNRLILFAQLNWRQIELLRACCYYLQQIHIGYSFNYIADTLFHYKEISSLLIDIFENRFNPNKELSTLQRIAKQQLLIQKFDHLLETVLILAEDRIFNCLLQLITSMLRTNFYQTTHQNQHKSYIAFKLTPYHLSNYLPKPLPQYEIYVYSTKFEGIHLRGGQIARGGIRWSDRYEDFRTEVLGLMKAQQVKNAVIVPVGAKGGFVIKSNHNTLANQNIISDSKLVEHYYQQFISALLDVTDNLINNQVIHPKQVIYYDEDDYYLVVAADKGTASFSDLANQVAKQYHFWLGDAFASGGSLGYDHKKMGITARGAWVSVQRHFREKKLNVQKDSITILGIGDMSGDVFGNGLLLSDTVKLVAAFNHKHIFIDPAPDPQISYQERLRLFNTPVSNWSDYNKQLISKGGGIFSRQEKYITITSEMKQVFRINAKQLTPNELIRALLKAPLDLLWNGGIGTYIKSSSENHNDVGDKANDNLRVNANELQVKVIGEGGNLGLTQLARIEYALHGGQLFTDSIDNSAGVDCSDHEVNIKILLNHLLEKNIFTQIERDQFLAHMTEMVAQLVLTNNYRQTQIISLTFNQSATETENWLQFIQTLQEIGKLDPELEFLPSKEMLEARQQKGQGLTKPELAILLSYSKTYIKEALINSMPIDCPIMISEFYTAFPKLLIDQYSQELLSHPLRRQITITQVANRLVDLFGMTTLHKIKNSTRKPLHEIACACLISREVFYIEQYWSQIESLDNQIDCQLQFDLMYTLNKIVTRASRKFLLSIDDITNMQTVIDHYAPRIQSFIATFDDYLHHDERLAFIEKTKTLEDQGIPVELSRLVAGSFYLSDILSIIQTADKHRAPLKKVAGLYFEIGQLLDIDNYYRYLNMKDNDHWQSLALDIMRNDALQQQQLLTSALLDLEPKLNNNTIKLIDYFEQSSTELLNNWFYTLQEIKSNLNHIDLAFFTAANQELKNLVRWCHDLLP